MSLNVHAFLFECAPYRLIIIACYNTHPFGIEQHVRNIIDLQVYTCTYNIVTSAKSYVGISLDAVISAVIQAS